MTRQADEAMHQIKHARVLEENTFVLSLTNLPPESHGDSYGNILIHIPYIGWRCIPVSKASEYIEVWLADYYTFCPPIPPPLSNNE